MRILMTPDEYNTYEEMIKNGISDLVALGFVCDTTENEVIIDEEIDINSIEFDEETEESDNVQETDEINEIDNVIEGVTENGNN